MGLVAIIIPGISEPAGPASYFGYVEGDYIYVAARHSGTIEEVFVRDGEAVNRSARLFNLNSERERQSLIATKARLSTAQSNWRDKTIEDRQEEIAIIESKLRSAEADQKLAELNYKRAQTLISGRVVSVGHQDQDHAAFETAKAKVKQLKAELAVARLPPEKLGLKQPFRT